MTPQDAMNLAHDLVANGRVDLAGAWQGYRVRGNELVAPDGQRIHRRRLEGLLWRDSQELRLAGFASRRKAEATRKAEQLVKVVVVPLSQYMDGRKIGAA
jgi:hypothetical protein